MNFLKWLFCDRRFMSMGRIEKKLYRFCNKRTKTKEKSCKDCPVEIPCRKFMAAGPNLYYALIDAEEK